MLLLKIIGILSIKLGLTAHFFIGLVLFFIGVALPAMFWSLLFALKMFAIFYAVLLVLSVIFLPIIFWLDQRWYRRHPGMNEYFARMDRELLYLEARERESVPAYRV